MYSVRSDVVLPLKHCSKCKNQKELNAFNKRKDGKDGLRGTCKECDNERHKIWYWQNKEQESERLKIWYQQNKERVRETSKAWYEQNKERKKETTKIWYLQNKELIRENSKAWYQQNKEHEKETTKIWYQQNKERVKENTKAWQTKQYKENSYFRLRVNVSGSIRRSLKRNGGEKRGLSCLKFLPYSIKQLKEHLESQFDCYMSWENHGNYDPSRYTWQIDHIVPHSSFRYESMDCEEFRQCWALSNLRPLQAIDNMKKGNR